MLIKRQRAFTRESMGPYGLFAPCPVCSGNKSSRNVTAPPVACSIMEAVFADGLNLPFTIRQRVG